MKSITLILLIVGVVAGTIIYLERPKASPVPSTPPVESVSSQPVGGTPSAKEIVIEPKQPRPISSDATDSKPVSTPPPVVIKPTPFSQAIDTLVSPQASFVQRQAVWRQLKEAGQLDQAIEALKQGVADHPNSVEYAAELGWAELQKAGVVSQNGGSINEMGILGMQADQNFDAALKLDPANWEAQFFKATSMSYWPAELNKGEEVVQRLSSLIDQQEATTSQPQFAQTYAVLGSEYQKMGQAEKAEAVWQLGLQKFPGDPTLQKKITSR